MADTIKFNEGLNYIGQNGLPATVYFLLSTRNVAAMAATDTLAGGVGEITGTGYVRTSEARPSPTNGSFAFAAKSWATGSATDWPANTKSVIAVTSSDNTGKALCAWNLRTGAESGLARDMSGSQTTEAFTPTITVS